MTYLPTAIYCILCSFTLASNGRKERVNEDECSARRCCVKRDEVIDFSLLPSPCETFSDEECGENDEFCIWECHPDDHHFGGGGHSRRFRGISAMDGHYEERVPDFEKKTHETFEDCMTSGRAIERDDCGVEYEDSIDEELLRQFCLGNHENSKFAGGQDNNGSSVDKGKRVVLGSDDRQLIPWVNRYVWPNGAVLYLVFTKGNGVNYRCTASMISPYWAITAGSCVYGDGDWYGNWRLYKYVHSCSDATASSEVTVNYAVTFASFITASDYSTKFSWDMAWLRLSQDPGLGYFGFGYGGFSGSINFNIISYPADKPDCSKYSQYCEYSLWDEDYQITYDCDTSGGASGSPVFRGNYAIFAIHTWTVTVGGVPANLATRITMSKFNAICSWVERDTPNRCP